MIVRIWKRPHYFPQDLEALIDPPQRVEHCDLVDLVIPNR